MCKMREEFEEWALERGFGVQKTNGFYDDPRSHDGWSAWQASRGALVIELPSDTRIRNEDMSRFSVKDACQEAIEGTGVKVLP